VTWLRVFLAAAVLVLGCAPKRVVPPREALEADDVDWTVTSEPRDEEGD
jgi:hypothetical protein